MIERRDVEQYFFTDDTASDLVGLAGIKPCWLCTPSVGSKAKRGPVLDMDTRFSFLGERFIEYDLHRGLHSLHRANGKRLAPLAYRFDTVVCDPPFSQATPDVIARNVNALLSWEPGATAYICYPQTGMGALSEAFLERGLEGKRSNVRLEYNAPPRNMGPGDAKEIVLIEFQRGGLIHY